MSRPGNALRSTAQALGQPERIGDTVLSASLRCHGGGFDVDRRPRSPEGIGQPPRVER